MTVNRKPETIIKEPDSLSLSALSVIHISKYMPQKLKKYYHFGTVTTGNTYKVTHSVVNIGVER